MLHYPTDSNLLFDATRKAVGLTAKLCDELEFLGWRQWKSLVVKCKSKLRALQNVRHSTSQSEEKKARRAQELKDFYSDFVDCCEKQVSKAAAAIQTINELNLLPPERSTGEIEMYLEYARLFQTLFFNGFYWIFLSLVELIFFAKM